MKELNPVNFAKITEYSESLRKEAESWKKEPWTWEDMVAQYNRLHFEM